MIDEFVCVLYNDKRVIMAQCGCMSVFCRTQQNHDGLSRRKIRSYENEKDLPTEKETEKKSAWFQKAHAEKERQKRLEKTP